MNSVVVCDLTLGNASLRAGESVNSASAVGTRRDIPCLSERTFHYYMSVISSIFLKTSRAYAMPVRPSSIRPLVCLCP